MKLKKNLAAKIAALVASFAALGGIWGVVHANPPVDASAATAVDPSPTAVPARSRSTTKQAAPQQVAPTRHTRTHAS